MNEFTLVLIGAGFIALLGFLIVLFDEGLRWKK